MAQIIKTEYLDDGWAELWVAVDERADPQDVAVDLLEVSKNLYLD